MTPLRWLAPCLLVPACLATPAAEPSLAPMRLKPEGLAGRPTDDNQIGSSGLSGVHTRVLAGDPSKTGLYSLLLFVPPNTSIPAHSHRDERMATVLSGIWRFGYGDRFDAGALEELPPGSVYSEPGGPEHNHFAQSGDAEAVVHITGFGPTDTHYVDPADEPHASKDSDEAAGAKR